MNSISRALRKAKQPPARADVRANHVASMNPGPPDLPNRGPVVPRVAPASTVAGSIHRAIAPAKYEPQSFQIHLRDYLHLVLKRLKAVVVIILVVPAVTAIFTVRQTPLYWATAVLQVNRERVRLVEDLTVDGSGASGEFYGTQLRLLQSKPLARRVVQQLKLWQHPVFGGSEAGVSEPSDQVLDWITETVRQWVSVRNLAGTELIETSFSSPDAQLSAALANSLGQQYISFVAERASGQAQSMADFIQEQVEKLEKQIESGQSFLDEHGMPESRHELAVQRLAALNGELTRAEAERAKAEIHLESLQTQNPASFPEVVDNPSIESARKQYEELLKAGDELAKRFGPDWPERSRVAASLEEAEKRLDAAVQEASERVLNVARHEYEAALKHEARLRQQAENERKKAESLEYLVATHDGATLELETQKRLLGELLRRESEAGLTVDLRQQSTINARIVEEATPPGGPYKPNLRKNLLMATAAGIFLAVGFAFFIEYWDSTIDTPEDLRRTVSIRYLGLIPRFENPPSANHPRRVPLPPGEVDNPAQYLALSLDESNLSEERRQISEHFNFVRTMLISSTHRPKTILVTSPDEKSGKTFVACNLAISLAKLEGRVLLVDADLRIPRLHQVFSVRNQRGLADLLRERTVTTPEYVRTDLDTLFLLTAGIDRRAPSEQLSADSTRSAIAAFAETFDYVVIDSAPLLPVPDSVALALHCEEVLLVVRSGYTTHQSLRASLDFVERTNGVVSGVILNDVDMNTLASSYYRSYRSTSY